MEKNLKELSFNELIQEYITDKFMETLKTFSTDNDFITERDKLNKAVEYSDMDLNSKRIVYQYIKSAMDNFFEAGFNQGMEFMRLMCEMEETQKGGAVQ